MLAHSCLPTQRALSHLPYAHAAHAPCAHAGTPCLRSSNASASQVRTVHADSVGVEAYLYAWGRIWELMGASDQPPWKTSDPALDSRVQELRDLVTWFDMWNEYNMKSKATQHLKKVGVVPCSHAHAPMHMRPCTCSHAHAPTHVIPCTCVHAGAPMHMLPPLPDVSLPCPYPLSPLTRCLVLSPPSLFAG
jgi:hypothetical protein